jgi:hypothetical protein
VWLVFFDDNQIRFLRSHWLAVCRERIKEVLEKATDESTGILASAQAISLMERADTIRPLGLPEPGAVFQNLMDAVQEEPEQDTAVWEPLTHPRINVELSHESTSCALL